jgi:glc operon protein GlcG
MNYLRQVRMLTDEAVQKMLDTAIRAARNAGQPQCIVIVDASGVVLSEFRMAGAKVLSMRSARAKAQTAASTRERSDMVPEAVRPLIAAATDGAMIGLPGGLPIRFGGECVGGIGVGSGTGEQDNAVAAEALAAVGADPA